MALVDKELLRLENVGEGLINFKTGDKVLLVFTGECKECKHYKSKESNMCDLLRINTERGVMISDGNSRFSTNGKLVYHFLGTSNFNQYIVLHAGFVAKINLEAPLDKVCILSCGVSTGKLLMNLFLIIFFPSTCSVSAICRSIFSKQ